MANKPPAQRWRTLRGGTGDYQIAYYDTKAGRDADAQRLANLDNDFVVTELWSADHPQDDLNRGWAMDGKADPRPSVPTYTQETITSALNAAADEILDAVDNPDNIRDGFNLLVNTAIHFLEHPGEDLHMVIAANYGDETYEEVLSWSNP